MITNENIRQTINDCAKAGHSVGMRDISYILLCKHYEDIATAYRILFGLDADFNADYVYTYDQTNSINYLRQYIENNLMVDLSGKKKKKKVLSDEEDISFEENKAGIVGELQKVNELEAAGAIDPAKAVDLRMKARIALNDKFRVQEDVRDQIVIVQNKYNDVCPRCQTELSRRPITKEEAMEMYDLVEKE